jgi:3-deoxy-D-manno-octulosonic-acid transferase
MNLKKRKIPIMLLNGRITDKSYKRWKTLPNFSKYIFGQIDKCLPSSKKSQTFLKKLGVSNIRFIGNIKFSQSENKIFKVQNKLKKFINSRKTWCASSTHYSEEKFCGLIHKKLKKKYKNLLTIIIPRHIDRIKSIESELNNLGLKTQTHEPLKKINNNIDVYLVNSYGQTKSFFNTCNIVFLGGSIINHGGQNPLEATRYGCNILHGPNIENFREIYEFLRKNKISSEVKNLKIALKKLNKLLIKQNNSKNIQIKLKKIGEKILQKTYKEIIF